MRPVSKQEDWACWLTSSSQEINGDKVEQMMMMMMKLT